VRKLKKTQLAVAAFFVLLTITVLITWQNAEDPARLVRMMNHPDKAREAQQRLIEMDVKAVDAVLSSSLDFPTKARILNRMSPRARRHAVLNVYRLAERGELMWDEHPELQPLDRLNEDIAGLLIEGAMDPDVNIQKTFLRIIEKRVGKSGKKSGEKSRYAGNSAFVGHLRGFTRSPDPRLRMYSAALLGRLGVGAAEDLGHLLDDQDPEVADWAALAMQRLGIKNHLGKILYLAEHGEPKARKTMMEVATALDAPRAVGALQRNLRSSNQSTRYFAAQCLGASGNKSSARLLAERLPNETAPVQAAIAGALIRLGRQEYYATLIGLLDEPRLPVRKFALNNLFIARLGKVPEGLKLDTMGISRERAKWLRWWASRTASKPAATPSRPVSR